MLPDPAPAEIHLTNFLEKQVQLKTTPTELGVVFLVRLSDCAHSDYWISCN
jgi:hypothetical protein